MGPTRTIFLGELPLEVSIPPRHTINRFIVFTNSLFKASGLSFKGDIFEKIFKNTITSYSPDEEGVSDGKTASDVERILAFHEIGMKDPLKYKTSWEEVLEYALNSEKKYKKIII